MSSYKEIVGQKITKVSSDPGDPKTGQMWYNTTTQSLRGLGVVSAWVSGASMSNSKTYRYGGGTTNAAFAAGGSPFPIGSTEEYNGSGWSSSGDLGTARYEGGSAGTQTAGLIYGGFSTTPQSGTEEYDGSSWTAGGALNTAGYSQGGFGIQTAAVYSSRSPGTINDTEEYNGTSWSEGNNQSQGRSDIGTGGTLTAGIIFGGQGPGPVVYTNTELYDGTNWTAGPAMNNARGQLGGSGIQTAAIGFGGRYTPPGTVLRAFTEQYDGTSWSETSDLANANRQLSSTRAETGNTEAIAFGGKISTGVIALTEEFTQSTNSITAAAWASGTNMPEANYGAGSFGTQTAFVYFGGMPYPPRTNATREYNGTSWATTGTYTGTVNYLAGTGVESAGLGAGGFTGTANPGASAEYDGSSWTAGNSMNQARMNTGSTMAGTQTAAAIAGGDQFPSTPRSLTATEEYDGTNWTAVTAMPTATQNMAVTGPQTASVFAGGISDTNPGTPNAYPTNVYEYDGTNWTAGGALPIGTYRAGAAGTQTDALIFSGGTSPGGPGGPGESVTTLGYDGTSWSSRPNMATARQSVGAGGTASPSTAAIGSGGYVLPGTTASTEEFTGTTETANIATFTTS